MSEGIVYLLHFQRTVDVRGMAHGRYCGKRFGWHAARGQRDLVNAARGAGWALHPDHRDPSPGGAVSHRVRNAAGEVRFEYVGMCPACRAGDRHELPTAEENLTKQRGTPDGGA